MEKDTIQQAREKSIVSYLEGKGHAMDKTKSSRNHTFFHSPFTSDRTPSFAVNNGKNTWTDYSGGGHGDAIDLVQKLEHCSFQEAVTALLGYDLPAVEIKKTQESSLIIHKTGPLSAALIAYLQSRKINAQLAAKYLERVDFSIEKKEVRREYYAMGWKNDQGGYELRNALMKIGSSPKWWTTLRSEQYDQENRVVVMEGFMDFLSLITKYNLRLLPYDFLILNSAAFVTQIDFSKWQKVVYMGDNDSAGTRCMEKIEHPNIEDARGLYLGFKDLNDWLCGKPIA